MYMKLRKIEIRVEVSKFVDVSYAKRLHIPSMFKNEYGHYNIKEPFSIFQSTYHMK